MRYHLETTRQEYRDGFFKIEAWVNEEAKYLDERRVVAQMRYILDNSIPDIWGFFEMMESFILYQCVVDKDALFLKVTRYHRNGSFLESVVSEYHKWVRDLINISNQFQQNISTSTPEVVLKPDG